jgi:hypothetical protein
MPARSTEIRGTTQVLRLLVLAALALGSACTALLPAPRPQAGYLLLEQVLADPFDGSATWDTYKADGLWIEQRDGAMHFDVAMEAYVWTQNRVPHDDAMLQITARSASPASASAYGLMCRASPQNDSRGYFFLIGTRGNASISIGDGFAVRSLTGWVSSDAIHPGVAANTLRAVCVGDYLALWVNDQFVVDTRDSKWSTGRAGLAAVVTEGNALTVRFDDLEVWRARLVD